MFIPIVLETRAPLDKNDYLAEIMGDGPDAGTEGGPPARDLDVGSLEILTEEEIPARVGAEVARSLRPLINRALAHWSGRVKLAAGESLESHRMGAIASSWEGLEAGTLVYLRRTSLADTAFVIPTGRIDLGTGRLVDPGPDVVWRFATPPFGDSGVALDRPEPLALAADASAGDVKTLVDAALTVVTFVGFGIAGPWGLALAGAAATGEVLFNHFFNTGKTGGADSIHDAVRSLLGQQQVSDMANALATSMNTFQENWRTSNPDKTELLGFLRAAQDQVQNTSPLNTALNSLGGNNPVEFMDRTEFLRKSISLYAYGISVKLLWIKALILLDDSVQDKSKSSYLVRLVKVGDEAIANIRRRIDEVRAAIDARGDRVTRCGDCHYTIASIGAAATTVYAVGFQDPEDPWSDANFYLSRGHLQEMVTPNGGCCHDQKDFATCENKRLAYIAKVREQVRAKYSFDADNLGIVLDKLSGTVDLYRKYLPN